MQLVITALAPIRRDVGDVLAAVRPCGIVTLRAEQHQKFLTVSCAAHTLVYHTHQLELPTLTFGCWVVFRVGHSPYLPLLVFLEFWQPQFLTNLVVVNTQLLNLFVCYVHFFTGFKIDAVDDTVRVNVFAVDVRADQYLTALEVFCQPPCGFVRRARVNVCALREALHHVVKHHAAILVVQQLCT